MAHWWSKVAQCVILRDWVIVAKHLSERVSGSNDWDLFRRKMFGCACRDPTSRFRQECSKIDDSLLCSWCFLYQWCRRLSGHAWKGRQPSLFVVLCTCRSFYQIIQSKHDSIYVASHFLSCHGLGQTQWHAVVAHSSSIVHEFKLVSETILST